MKVLASSYTSVLKMIRAFDEASQALEEAKRNMYAAKTAADRCRNILCGYMMENDITDRAFRIEERIFVLDIHEDGVNVDVYPIIDLVV